ncbi:MAG: hypothetical protein ACP6IP_03220 [Candidatus Njordarchaeia archaeon]
MSNELDDLLNELLSRTETMGTSEENIRKILNKYVGGFVKAIIYSDLRGINFISSGDLPDDVTPEFFIMPLTVIIATSQNLTEKVKDKLEFVITRMKKFKIACKLVDNDHFISVVFGEEPSCEEMKETLKKISEDLKNS